MESHGSPLDKYRFRSNELKNYYKKNSWSQNSQTELDLLFEDIFQLKKKKKWLIRYIQI